MLGAYSNFYSSKLVIAHLPRTIWPMFSSFLIFCNYFTSLKAPKLHWQHMGNSANTGNIVLKSVRQLLYIFILSKVYLRRYEPIPSRYLLAQNKHWRHHNNVWNLFKVNNKDTRKSSVTSSCVLIGNFGQISYIVLAFLLLTLSK